ncbi:hypothetical protein L1987_81546 [Smallanthus sonchifolius]|uniref:Uncharacterized protein n=1 Tax=Smallanthus sonchifolius TaxID=185202 RepID=A0ACB8YRV1_9ASTR|nr:hypothetical protein L1987_81546 [Smallanthus sonchifolius]
MHHQTLTKETQNEKAATDTITKVAINMWKMNKFIKGRSMVLGVRAGLRLQEDANQISSGIRKVTWSDAHGKSIAHVQEFEPRLASYRFLLRFLALHDSQGNFPLCSQGTDLTGASFHSLLFSDPLPPPPQISFNLDMRKTSATDCTITEAVTISFSQGISSQYNAIFSQLSQNPQDGTIGSTANRVPPSP